MPTTRRQFLSHSAKTGLALASLPLLTQCGGATEHTLRPIVQADDLQQRIGQEGMAILRYASLAPNGHNTQPWKVTIVEPRRWILESDRSRWLPAVDPANRELLLSLGAFLENLVQAAASFGYAVELTVLAQSSNDQRLVEIVLRQGTVRAVNLEPLRLRRTLRKGLLAKELTADDVRFLVGDDAAHWHYFPANSSQSAYLNEGTVAANRIQAYRADAQQELAAWMRWSNEAIAQHLDGITPATMEITGFAGWYVRTFYGRDDVLKKSFRETTIKTVAQQVGQHGGWLVLTAPISGAASAPSASKPAAVDNVAELLEIGRCFQRLSLRLRERLIAVHPMTQMLEEPQWQYEVSSALGLAEQAHFLLRTGYVASYPEPVSPRRPVDWFTHVA